MLGPFIYSSAALSAALTGTFGSLPGLSDIRTSSTNLNHQDICTRRLSDKEHDNTTSLFRTAIILSCICSIVSSHTCIRLHHTSISTMASKAEHELKSAAEDLEPAGAAPLVSSQPPEPDSPSSPSSANASEKFPDHDDTQSPSNGEPPIDQAPVRPELYRTKSRASEFSKARTTAIIFALCMALFLAALDVTIITTALPTIAEKFHANASDYTWVGSAYLLANAASVPLWGKLSVIWGR